MANTTKSGEESTDLSPMTALEGDKEKVKEGKGLKILSPNKLLTTLPILLAQLKAGNISHKKKTKSDRNCIFCINAIKSLKISTAN